MSAETSNNMFDWLFNPFRVVAGWRAFGIGLGLIVVTSVHGALAGVRFDGLLRINMGETTIVFELAKQLGFTAIYIALLGIAGKLLSRSQFRLLDLVGTQWLARWPFVLVSLVLFHIPGYKELTLKLLTMKPVDIATSIEGSEMLLLMGVGLAVLAMTVWTLILQYFSFAVSCNVKGGKAVTVFIIVFLVASTGDSLLLQQLRSLS
ncbi:MAG TPA: hypothetical protein VMH83_13550 [Candidatus Acidoferrum sp.]|nr:hypothetical protein [Candidatus Acidoferrum sp.]